MRNREPVCYDSTLMHIEPVGILAAFFGASLQEIVHWYELRSKLSLKRYKAQLASPAYWIITFTMIAASVCGTILWFANDHTSPEPKTVMIMAAAFPMFFKRAVDLATRKQDTTLEPRESGTGSVVRDYLSVS